MIARKNVEFGPESQIHCEWWGHVPASLDCETNGCKGGDAGHGGYLRISLQGLFSVKIDGGPEQEIRSFALSAHGDDEMRGLSELLQALSHELPQMLKPLQ